MKKNREIFLAINLLIIFIIFFGGLIAIYINRDGIYNFLSKKADENTHEVLNANPGNIPANVQYGNGFDETQPQTPSPTLPPAEPSTDELIATSDETPETESETENAEEPTFPPPESETLPSETIQTIQPDETTSVKYIEAPKSEFMQAMFDSAIEIPDSGNKIEPPPAGRSVELQYGAVPLSDTVPDPCAYFKDALFLGDSVTTGFDLYKKSIQFNGEAVMQDITVVAVGSYGVYNATREISGKSIHPLFEGQKTLPEDIIAKKNVKNVFICLGLNDLVWEKTEDFIAYYTKLINNIKAKSPDKNIIIMSVTPIVAGQTISALTSDAITAGNNALLELAILNGIPFIDYGAAIRDSGNNLYGEFSSDGYCHLKIDAYNRLVEYMLFHPIKY